jgi:beta-lactamase superfamily II metal-dependent hydrolase
MTDNLVVRMYTIRFGDAILITVPDRNPSTGKTVTRRILVDVGNAPKVAGSGEGGSDEVFEAVVGDILDQLDGHPLDLYVMTHEHLDHAQGLFYASTKLPALDLARRLEVRHVWLTGSADPHYYDDDKHPEAKKQLDAFQQMYHRVAALMADRPTAATRLLAEMLANNDPTKTRQCVEYLRTLNPAKTHYIHREAKLRGTHPFREAKLSVWAPEEDTAEYYGRFLPLDAGAVPVPPEPVAGRGARRRTQPADPEPPPGVDVGAFLRLVEARRGGIVDNLLAIDKAANNTSIVFALEWRGWRLLFAGDAEVRSWKTMAREGVLKPVHFLKVSHHGSHNGTPADDIFEAILPATAPDGRPREAAISTWEHTYSGIPHAPTNARLAERATVHSTLDRPDDLFYEVTFPG